MLVQCHVSSTARARLLELMLKASFSEPEVSAGTRVLSHTVRHYVEAGAGSKGGATTFLLR